MKKLKCDGYTVIVATLPRKGKKVLMFGQYFQKENNADDYLTELSDYCYSGNFKYPVVPLAIPGNAVNAPEFGLDSNSINPTEWIETLEEYTDRVNAENPENLAIDLDADGNEVFADSIVQIRDISPVGSINYISMICKRNGEYGYYQDDVFIPLTGNEMMHVMKAHANANDFMKMKDFVAKAVKDGLDENIDALIWCEKSMLKEDEISDSEVQPTSNEKNTDEDDIVIDPGMTQFVDLSKYFDHDNDGEKTNNEFAKHDLRSQNDGCFDS